MLRGQVWLSVLVCWCLVCQLLMYCGQSVCCVFDSACVVCVGARACVFVNVCECVGVSV